MPTLSALSLRFSCNQESREPLQEDFTDQDPIIYRGSPTVILASLFSGEPSAATFASVSNVSEVRVILRKNHPLGVLLLNKTGTVDDTTTYNNWIAGTKQHFAFTLTSSETNLQTPSDGTLDVHGVIVATVPTGPLTIGYFNGSVNFNGAIDDIPPTTGLGTNYVVQDGIFKVWNNDQGIFQAIFPVGADGAESVAVGE